VRLRIGEFARRCGLPVSTLRFYDQVGVLRPSVVDAATGYRWYSAAQVPVGLLIARLRAAGVPPSLIGPVLAGGPAAAAVLRAQHDRLRTEITARHTALATLEALLTGLPPAGVAANLPHAVRVVHLAAEAVVALPVAGAPAELATAVLRGVARLRSSLRRGAVPWTGPWGGAFPVDLSAPVVHGFVFVRLASGDPDMATCRSLDTAWLPGGPAAEVVHSQAALPEAYRQLFQWISTAGRTIAGPVVEEYLPDRQVRVLIPLAA
jgi:DNA-binding transcriptional MerR regulator